MKRLCLLLLISLFILNTTVSVFAYRNGDVIGYSLTTDIIAQINGYDIASYNYRGNTYLIAEDLADYGFDVSYNNNTRTLYVTRDYSVSQIFSTYKKLPVSQRDVGKKAFNLLYTDIKTYIDGKYVTSYNINGRTIIAFDDLAAYGNYVWHSNTRKITLDMAGINHKPESSATTEYVNIYYDGKNLCYDNLSAFFYDGEIMVPFEHISEALNSEGAWGEFWEQNGTSYYTGGDAAFAFTEGNKTAYIYGSDGSVKEFPMSVAPLRKNGILFVPLKTFCEMNDMVMSWNDSYTAIYLKYSF